MFLEMHCLGHLFAYPGEVSVGLGKTILHSHKEEPSLGKWMAPGMESMLLLCKLVLKRGQIFIPKDLSGEEP